MKKSFTLIEVLISIFLLSLLLGLVMYSFKLYLHNFEAIKLSIPKKVINYEVLDKNLKSIYPYPINNFKKYYFIKTKNSIQYISLYGFVYSSPVVSKLECLNNKLIYIESPLYNKYQNYLHPIILSKIFYKRNLFTFKNYCKIKVELKEGFPYFIEINLDTKRYFFKPEIDWYNLKKILQSMENQN